MRCLVEASGSAEEWPPLAHREALVCALCAQMLDASLLPPRPQLEPCASPEALEERLRSSGIALDATAALRSNARRCCLAPLSFAAELASRRIDQPSLPQVAARLELKQRKDYPGCSHPLEFDSRHCSTWCASRRGACKSS